MFTNEKNPEKEVLEKKKSNLTSRYYHLESVQRDYDDKKGKGAFRNKYPNAVKMMNLLLDEKTQLGIKLASMDEPKKESIDLIDKIE